VATRATDGRKGHDGGHRVPPVLLGALLGAVLVLGIAAALGGAIEGLASPLVLIAFALAGAIFGAFAWGAVAYDRRSRPPVGRAG
jgi:hypothetical protein